MFLERGEKLHYYTYSHGMLILLSYLGNVKWGRADCSYVAWHLREHRVCVRFWAFSFVLVRLTRVIEPSALTHPVT